MVDAVEQLEHIEAAAAATGPLRVCIDVDAGWRTLGGRVRIGVKRSPQHTPDQASQLARAILARERIRLAGLMLYEAQIAGLGDAPLGSRSRIRDR